MKNHNPRADDPSFPFAAIFRLLILGSVLLLFSGGMNLLQAETIPVADGDVAGLIAALENAEGGDVIVLAENGHYLLTAVHNTTDAANGLPVISNEIIIEGNGATIERDSEAPDFRIFYLDGVGPDARFSNLIIKGGGYTGYPLGGAGMYALNSSPEIAGCTFLANHANEGGGLYNDGSSPRVIGCVFLDNSGLIAGGGLANFNNANPLITDSLFEDNEADGSGAGILNVNSSPEITNCIFRVNQTDQGAGIGNFGGSNPKIANCEFIENEGNRTGGAIYNYDSNPTIIDCLFKDNFASVVSHGGAVANRGSSPLIMNCRFVGNWSDDLGGAMSNAPTDNNDGNPLIINCVFEGNEAISGGAMTNIGGIVTIIDCVFKNNRSFELGGVMQNIAGSNVLIMRSEFNQNWAPYNLGYNVDEGGHGGAIYNEGSTVTIYESFFRANIARLSGGAIFNDPNGLVQISSTLFCANDPDVIAGSWEDLGDNQFNDACDILLEPALAILSIEFIASDELELIIDSPFPALEHQVQYKTELTDPEWTNVEDVTISVQLRPLTQASFALPEPNAERGFFRVIWEYLPMPLAAAEGP